MNENDETKKTRVGFQPDDHELVAAAKEQENETISREKMVGWW